MSKRATKKRPVGRPRTGKRPVIAMRIHPDLYEQIMQSAIERKVSIAEDATNRLQQSLDWDRTAGDVRKMIADAERVIAGEKEAALRKMGLLACRWSPWALDRE